MSELMISPSILDFDGGFEGVGYGCFLRDAALLGLVIKRKANQHIDEETPVRRAAPLGSDFKLFQ